MMIYSGLKLTWLVPAGLLLVSLTEPVMAQNSSGGAPASSAAATTTLPSGRIVRPTLQPGSQGEAVRELQAVLSLLGFYSGAITGQYQEPTEAAVKQFQAAAGLTPDGITGPATWSRLFPTPPNEANPPVEATAPASTSASTTPASTPASTPSAAAGTPTPSTPAATTPPATTPASPSTPAQTPAAQTGAARPSAPSGQPVLRLGDRGEAVVTLQTRLKALGFYQGGLDGVFGTQTEEAVQRAQRASGLTPDGIVGPATWNVLDQAD